MSIRERFHALTKNVSFSSLTDVGFDNLSSLRLSLLAGTSFGV